MYFGVKTETIESIDQEVLSVYEAFKQKNGSEHISSPIGIQILLEIIRETNPRNILEVGGGIGALSFAALKYSDAHIDIFENNLFCLEELKKNLKGYEGRYTLLEDYNNFKLPHNSYDLLIIDGGGHAFIRNLISKCDHIGGLIIEGSRREQRKQARKALSAKYVFRPERYIHVQKEYKGANRIYCYRSNNPVFRFLSYWFWEILIFEEIKLSLRYRLSLLMKMLGKSVV